MTPHHLVACLPPPIRCLALFGVGPSLSRGFCLARARLCWSHTTSTTRPACPRQQHPGPTIVRVGASHSADSPPSSGATSHAGDSTVRIAVGDSSASSADAAGCAGPLHQLRVRAAAVRTHAETREAERVRWRSSVALLDASGGGGRASVPLAEQRVEPGGAAESWGWMPKRHFVEWRQQRRLRRSDARPERRQLRLRTSLSLLLASCAAPSRPARRPSTGVRVSPPMTKAGVDAPHSSPSWNTSACWRR